MICYYCLAPYNFATVAATSEGTSSANDASMFLVCSRLSLVLLRSQMLRINVEDTWLYLGSPSMWMVGIGIASGPYKRGPQVLRTCKCRSSLPSFSQLRMPRKKRVAPVRFAKLQMYPSTTNIANSKKRKIFERGYKYVRKGDR